MSRSEALVTADWAEQNLNTPGIVLVEVDEDTSAYDGGHIAADGLADHLIVSRSQHIPRIQEAQAGAYHALRELVELAAPGERP